MEQFPGNSKSDRSRAPDKEKPPPKQVNKVVKGTIARQKQPISKRLKAHFMPDTDLPISEHIIFEVLLPGATAAASEVFHQSIDILLPYSGRNRGHGGRSRGYTQYSKGSGGRGGNAPWNRDEDPRDVVSRRARNTHNYSQIVIDDRVDAEEVLDELYNLLNMYDQVTVGDFYDAVGATKEFTDENYGWTTLSGTRIIRRGGGWVVDLPATEQLNRR